MSECRAACLTPAGRGAIATIVVFGPEARSRVAACFSPMGKPPLHQRALNHIVFGRWGETPNQPGEELVVCCRTEVEIEIHCHGGSAAVNRILADLHVSGCEIVPMNDWTAAMEPDVIAGEARQALAQATTERTAAVLLDQYRGTLRSAMDRLHQQLSHADGEMEDRRSAAITELESLLASSEFGRHLTEPWKIVLAGPPNVGKSLLMNRLLGYDRSIVFDQAGTTRDVLSGRTAIAGWPVELSDTAGLRPTNDSIESAGVERAWRHLSEADLIVWVSDAREGVAAVPTRILMEKRQIQVRNKIDFLENMPTERPSVNLRTAPRQDAAGSLDPSIATLGVSALTGQGISELVDLLAATLVPTPPPLGSAIPFTPRQIQLLTRCCDGLRSGESLHSVATRLADCHRGTQRESME